MSAGPKRSEGVRSGDCQIRYLGLGLGLELAIRKSDADSDARVKKQIEIQ